MGRYCRPFFYMLDCLKDYIGFIHCMGVYEQPESGLFINTLPGISLESIDKIADSEQITYRGVWNDAQLEAIPRFRLDFIADLTKCFELSLDCDYDALICTNKQKLAVAFKYLLGNQLMIFRLFTSRLNRFTTVDRDEAKELKDFYQAEYEKALAQAVKLIDVTDCACKQCGGSVSYVTYLP